MEEGEVLVNLASNEYNKAVDLKNIKGRVVTCAFKEERNGEYKAIMTFAKRARGTMSRFIIQNDIENPEDLKALTWITMLLIMKCLLNPSSFLCGNRGLNNQMTFFRCQY